MRMLKCFLAGFMVCGVAACSEPPSGEHRVAPKPDSVIATSPNPDSAALERYRRALPASVLARKGACPFECCVYGDWLADTTFALYRQPQISGGPAFVINKGEKFKADSGVVFVTGIGLAIVDDTVFRYADRKPWLLPGDTLVLLDPIGEGYWNAWRRGEVLKEVPPFFESIPEAKRGRLIGKPEREWWVHATAGDRSGWIDMQRARVRGADACGGPVEGL